MTGGTWFIEHGTAYLLCFDLPFGKLRPMTRPEAGKVSTASHYLGVTDDLPGRARWCPDRACPPGRHRLGRGPCLARRQPGPGRAP